MTRKTTLTLLAARGYKTNSALRLLLDAAGISLPHRATKSVLADRIHGVVASRRTRQYRKNIATLVRRAQGVQ